MSLNLSFVLDEAVGQFADNTAMMLGEARWTYRQLMEGACRVANALLGQGVRPGDKVALACHNVPNFTVAYYGILRAGCTVVPISILSVADEVAYFLEDSDAVAVVAHQVLAETAAGGMSQVPSCKALLVTGEGPMPKLAAGAGRVASLDALAGKASAEKDLPVTMPDDTAVILYTSGTTGKSKGAELTHFNLYSNAQWMAQTLVSEIPKDIHFLSEGQVSMAALPLFHSFGQTCMQNAFLLYGGAISYVPRFEAAAALQQIQDHKVTVFAGVPTMYAGFCQCPERERYDLSSMQVFLSGGAALPIPLGEEFKAKFGKPIFQGYGLTETSPIACFSRTRQATVPGSSGLAMLGVEFKIIDEQGAALPVGENGEIAIRGHNIMKGYYKKPEATAEAIVDGWFKTGDMGHLDEKGHVYIVGRKKEMIIRGGFNVYPLEVEQVMLRHEGIREVCIIGVPSEKYGEEVKAVVVLEDGADLKAEEVTAWAKAHMAGHKYPRIVEFREELPKGPTGKVLRRQLQEEHQG